MAWDAHVAATIKKYIKKVTTDTIVRRKVFLAKLESKGRITFNNSGTEVQWPVRFKRNELRPISIEAPSSTFQQITLHKKATLGWRGYEATRSINKGNKLQNRGKEQIVNLWGNVIKETTDDMRFNFQTELIQRDGNAAGSTDRVHGLESIFSVSGAASHGFVGLPNDEYGGLNTTLGNYGGSWTASSWPDGNGDAEYAFWSPLVVDVTDTSWAASTKTWRNTCEEAVRFAIVHSYVNGYMLDLMMVSPNRFREFLDSKSPTERTMVQRNGQESKLVKYGFGQIINQDGVDIVPEPDVGSVIGYGVSCDTIELMSQQDQLFVPEQDYDIETSSDRMKLDFYGQMKIESPRSQVKFQAIT